MSRPSLERPIHDSYVVPGTQLIAGEFPGTKPDRGSEQARSKLSRFLDAGISAFVDLTDPIDGLAPYEELLATLAADRGVDVTYERLTIRDMDVCDAAHMTRILDTIDARLAEGRRTYVHCWGGVGRTGMVVACWLVRRGLDGDQALRQVKDLFNTMSPGKLASHGRDGSPQTPAQHHMVRSWHVHERRSSDDQAP